jgi:hypothetical protein
LDVDGILHILSEGSDGLPGGGLTGQVLAKQSNTDYDADWETLTASGLLAGDDYDTLYYNGTDWVASDTLQNEDNTIRINASTYAAGSFTSLAIGVQETPQPKIILHGIAAGNTFLYYYEDDSSNHLASIHLDSSTDDLMFWWNGNNACATHFYIGNDVSNSTIGFYGVTPVIQPASADQELITTDMSSDAFADELKTKVNEILESLTDLGLIKGEA